MRARVVLVVASASALLVAGVWQIAHRQSRSHQAQAHLRPVTLERSLRAIEDGARTAPRDRWDPQYVVDRLGRDPTRIIAWVRNHTYWIPYRGELRGPVGVLMDRRGNSLDRAVLLATLLEKAGQTVRLAHGRLTREQAAALLPALAVNGVPSLPADPDSQAWRLPVLAAATRYGLDAAAIERGMRARQVALVRIAHELDARVSAQTARLLSTVPHASTVSNWAERYAGALTALQDHWWVQWHPVTEAGWVDVDVTRAARDATTLRVAANETMTLEELPTRSQSQEIVLRVIARQTTRQGQREYTALRYVLRPADLIGTPISLQFIPESVLTASPSPSQSSTDWRRIALAERHWAAALRIGSQYVAAAALSDTGDDPDVPQRGGPMGSIAAAFSDSLDAGAQAAVGPARGQLSAVRLEYELRLPGSPPRVIRRSVFELPDARAHATRSGDLPSLAEDTRLRRSLALTGEIEILPLSCELAPQYILHLVAISLRSDRQLLRLAASGTLTRGGAELRHALEARIEPPDELYELSLARFAWNAHAARIFIDRPNLLTLHHVLLPTRGHIDVRGTIDIVANGVGVSPLVEDGFAAQVMQGVLDTNAESLVLGRNLLHANVGDGYAKDASWITLQSPRDVSAAAGLALPPAMQTLVLDQLARGYTIVAPQSARDGGHGVSPGWWRIDRSTGETLGIGANGWGAALEGEAAEESWAVRYMANLRTWKNVAKGLSLGFNQFFWCMAPIASHDVEQQGLRLGVINAVLSSKPCAAEGVTVGIVGMLTLPIVALTLGMDLRLAKVADETPKEPGIIPPGGSGGPRAPEGQAPPESNASQPDTGRAAGGSPGTKPPATAASNAPGTPGQASGSPATAGGSPGSNPASPGPCGVDEAAADDQFGQWLDSQSEGPPTARDPQYGDTLQGNPPNSEPPGGQSGTPDTTDMQQLAGNVERAYVQLEAAQQKVTAATAEAVAYNARRYDLPVDPNAPPDSSGGVARIPNSAVYDPTVAQALNSEAWEAMRSVDQAEQSLQQAQRALRNAEDAAKIQRGQARSKAAQQAVCGPAAASSGDTLVVAGSGGIDSGSGGGSD
jgi:hypothetical protein